jgi:hypothetical protein
MSNILDNGAILPHGLLSASTSAKIAGFNKSYNNTKMRLGVIVEAFAVDDPNNRTQISTEYDVVTLEQNEDKGATTITYRNCLCKDGIGGIADFFEMNLRSKTQQSYKGEAIQLSGQNGTIVLLECLDGASDKAMIVGGFPNLNRETTLVDTQPRLTGEYNGVRIAVNPDGSTSLTFKGATDNNGNQLDPSQGNTVFQIKTDGSFEFNHSTINIQADRSGVLTITTTSNANITVGANANITVDGNTNIDTSGTANIIAQGTTTIDGSTIKLGVNAVQSVIRGNDFAAIFDAHVHISEAPGTPTSAPTTTMDSSLSDHVFTE